MNALQKQLIFLACFLHCIHIFAQNNHNEFITIAILAKDKAHTLDLYLSCIENQTWPQSQTNLYIRTNNNNDNTAQILRDWIARVGNKYAQIYFDDTNVAEPVQNFGQHEWNYTRFKVLGKIRQDSVNWAYENNSHYFVADCDNFIFPDTIERLFNTNVPIVAPMLRCCASDIYSNYHFAIDENGYWGPGQMYYTLLHQEVRGIIEVSVVHCTYLIRHEVLNKIYYDDASERHEYVIFSDSARKQNIPQYLDNRKHYGYISFAETSEELKKEAFLNDFCPNCLFHLR
jgi:hypothetical protein